MFDKFDKFKALLNSIHLCYEYKKKGLDAVVIIDNTDVIDEVILTRHPGIKFIKKSQSIEYLNESLFENLYVIICFQYCVDAYELMDFLINNCIKFIPAAGHPVGGYLFDDPIAREVIERCFFQQSYDGYAKFEDPGTLSDFANIIQFIRATRNVVGDYVEIGCFNGSSGGIALEYAKTSGVYKSFYFFDTFDGFNYEEAFKSSDAIWSGGHISHGYDAVRSRLINAYSSVDVVVEKINIINQRLPSKIKKIALANIDVDLYEAVFEALNKIAPLVSHSGVIICEDVGHTPALIGARFAFEQFLKSNIGANFLPIYMESGQGVLVKVTE